MEWPAHLPLVRGGGVSVTAVCVLLLTLGFHPFLVSLNDYYLVIFWAHWMLNIRSIDVC